MSETYTMPPDGWVCFHCGERFTTWGTAQDHFGKMPEDVAACKLGGERGLVMELRKAENMCEEQLQRALNAEREIENLQGRVEALTTNFQSFKPFRDCRSANEAFFVYDSMEGRALAAEEKLEQLEKALTANAEQIRQVEEEIVTTRVDLGFAKTDHTRRVYSSILARALDALDDLKKGIKVNG